MWDEAMSQYYKLCLSVSKRCTNVGRFFFSVCILTSRMKRASQLWDHLKLCTLIAGKYSFVIKIGVVPFTCFLELNLWEAYVTKHTKVPVMNIECSFCTLLLSKRWKCASVCNVTRTVVTQSVALHSTPQVVIPSE